MNNKQLSRLANMVTAYLDAMVFFDFEEENPDAQLSQETFDKAYDDCNQFIQLAKNEKINFEDEQMIQVGHDFYLTRNGHGAGFGDGDWNDDYDYDRTVGDVLTEICESMSMQEHYVGDDNEIYPL